MNSINFKAINKKHQARIDKVIYWYQRYDKLNDLRNKADDNDDAKAYNK